MSDFNYSVVLRELSDEYFSHKISKAEYRNQRTLLLDKIDAEYNGRKTAHAETTNSTVEDDSFFMKTVAFFKNKNVE